MLILYEPQTQQFVSYSTLESKCGINKHKKNIKRDNRKKSKIKKLQVVKNALMEGANEGFHDRGSIQTLCCHGFCGHMQVLSERIVETSLWN